MLVAEFRAIVKSFPPLFDMMAVEGMANPSFSAIEP